MYETGSVKSGKYSQIALKCNKSKKENWIKIIYELLTGN